MNFGRRGRHLLGIALVVAFAAAVALGLIARSRPGSDPIRLVVYAFSTTQELMEQSIIPGFERSWQMQSDRPLEVVGSYGASGTLAGQIVIGAPASVAVLSHERHVDVLKAGHRVRPSVAATVFAWTPLAIAVRPGNPMGLHNWSDLALPGVRVLHPDPRTSGAGAWGVLAEYGSALYDGGEPAAAEAGLRAIWSNVGRLEPSARGALALFEWGAGDALVTYEQDALLARGRGAALEVVVPRATIAARTVAVVVDDCVTEAQRPAAQAFVDYLSGLEGQAACEEYGFHRAVDAGVDAEPPAGYFTVDDLGGWSRAHVDILEGVWHRSILPDLELEEERGSIWTEGRG